MIASIVIILAVLAVFAVGFFAGVRYCASNRVLPGVLARMSSEQLDDLAAQAGTIRTRLNSRSAR